MQWQEMLWLGIELGLIHCGINKRGNIMRGSGLSLGDKAVLGMTKETLLGEPDLWHLITNVSILTQTTSKPGAPHLGQSSAPRSSVPAEENMGR